MAEAKLELLLHGASYFHRDADIDPESRLQSDRGAFLEALTFNRFGSLGQKRFMALYDHLKGRLSSELTALMPDIRAYDGRQFDREFAMFGRVLGFADLIASAVDPGHEGLLTWEKDNERAREGEDRLEKQDRIAPAELDAWKSKISPLFVGLVEKSLRDFLEARKITETERARAEQENLRRAREFRQANPGSTVKAEPVDGTRFVPMAWTEHGQRLAPYDFRDRQNILDTVREFTIYAVLPEIVRRLPASFDLHAFRVQEVIDGLLPSVALALFGAERAVDKVLGISERWHAGRDSIMGGDGAEGDPTKIRTITRKGGWDAILEDDFVVEEGLAKGYRIKNLKTSEELDAEGRAQNNCVASYSGACKENRIHIFSVRDPQNRRVSTFGLYLEKRSSGRPLLATNINLPGSDEFLASRNTHLGRSNTSPNEAAQAAFAAFKAAIESGRLPVQLPRDIDRQSVRTENALPLAIEEIGFIPSVEKNDQVFKLFKESRFKARIFPDGRRQYGADGSEIVEQANASHFMPPGYKKKTVQEFYEESGLAEIAQRIVKEIHR